MSYTIEIVDILENRIKAILSKLDKLEQDNQKLSEELAKSKQETANLKLEIQEIQEKNNSLQVANSLLGSDEFKKNTKLKINTLVREIDHCISQLSK